MPLADWTVPFRLRSSVFAGATELLFNTQTASGIYILRHDGCTLNNTVRLQKENVPQEDGAILHRRYVAGMEMVLAIQMWDRPDQIACDESLQAMLDDLMGYLYGLLNAGDNEGRISWLPAGNSSPYSNYRMLDDIRLMTYPAESQGAGSPYEIGVTLDCALPYAEDETQFSPPPPIPGPVINAGNRPTYPVWKIVGTFTSFTMTATFPDTSTAEFSFDGSLNGGGGAVTTPDYLEINTFNNTVYLNGSGANRMPGIVMPDSEFFSLPPGTTTIAITYGGGAGGASVGLINAAWA